MLRQPSRHQIPHHGDHGDLAANGGSLQAWDWTDPTRPVCPDCLVAALCRTEGHLWRLWQDCACQGRIAGARRWLPPPPVLPPRAGRRRLLRMQAGDCKAAARAVTAEDHRPPVVTAEQLTRALLEVAATVRWPDGPLLLDLDVEVLREQLSPRLLATLVAAGSDAGTSPAFGCSLGAQSRPALTDPYACQEHPC